MASKRMGLPKIVEAFLGLALVHPEKEPRTQRAQRDNEMVILGYNRAQEDLRSLLQNHGRAESVRALAVWWFYLYTGESLTDKTWPA